MLVPVVGGTGEVGQRVVRRLLADGHAVTALAPSANKAEAPRQLGARAVETSLFDPRTPGDALAGHDAVVNLATHIPVGSAATRARAWREDDRIRAAHRCSVRNAELRFVDGCEPTPDRRPRLCSGLLGPYSHVLQAPRRVNMSGIVRRLRRHVELPSLRAFYGALSKSAHRDSCRSRSVQSSNSLTVCRFSR